MHNYSLCKLNVTNMGSVLFFLLYFIKLILSELKPKWTVNSNTTFRIIYHKKK